MHEVICLDERSFGRRFVCLHNRSVAILRTYVEGETHA